MDVLTYCFPVAVVFLILLIFSDFFPLLRSAPKEIPGTERSWTRRDSLTAGVLTLVYAFVAFLGLGNTHGVQSYCKFADRGEYALITLDEPTEIGAVRYFAGIYMGNYYLQFSEDGEDFTDVGVLSQGHADVLKWLDAELDEDRPLAVRAIRLIADSQLWLGELAIYDGAGRLLTLEEMTPATGCGKLFDEQAEIPETYDYMNSSYFDEIYHARTALEHLENVYPYEITHPPLGKLILSAGIAIFGMTPFGWRFSGTLIGVLMVPAIYLFLKKMFGGRRVPLCVGAVFTFDFMHYVQTRIATIDSYSVFFIILMYLAFWLYWDADRSERRNWLPPLAFSGLFFGLGAASKWTCFYAGAGLGVLWLIDRIWRYLTLRREGRGGEYFQETVENILWCLLFFVLVPSAIYYLSYIPYGTASGLSMPGMLLSRDYLGIVVNNQSYMLSYHAGVTATHPYSSVWWQWMLDVRPILYYLQYPGDGTHVSFGAWVNPMLCWGGLLAMLCVAWFAIRRRDRTALFLLVGYLAQLLPWVFVTRVVFEYHYFPSTVFLTLALAYVFRQLELSRPERKWGVVTFAAVSVALFALFYPALRGLPVSSSFGKSFLKWLPSWPF
ncbi:MAG: phospholipid carrier-dependent glycosyltransferase [Oscillospiraceae bacterium]|nr:phospholipid carrier-dependent glycosyltransferase [Oscillospiraceae bacterium]